jgi:MYXO-CTERM domain-containing protein
MSIRSLVAASGLGLTLAWGAAASADVIPPEEMVCQDRTPGVSCAVDGVDGQCVESTCSRLDYSRWDGGPEGPPTTEYDCLICETDGSGGSDGGAGGDGDAGAGGGDDGDGGCAAAFGDPEGPIGWAAAGLLALAGLVWRRRRG